MTCRDENGHLGGHWSFCYIRICTRFLWRFKSACCENDCPHPGTSQNTLTPSCAVRWCLFRLPRVLNVSPHLAHLWLAPPALLLLPPAVLPPLLPAACRTGRSSNTPVAMRSNICAHSFRSIAGFICDVSGGDGSGCGAEHTAGRHSDDRSACTLNSVGEWCVGANRALVLNSGANSGIVQQDRASAVWSVRQRRSWSTRALGHSPRRADGGNRNRARETVFVWMSWARGLRQTFAGERALSVRRLRKEVADNLSCGWTANAAGWSELRFQKVQCSDRRPVLKMVFVFGWLHLYVLSEISWKGTVERERRGGSSNLLNAHTSGHKLLKRVAASYASIHTSIFTPRCEL